MAGERKTESKGIPGEKKIIIFLEPKTKKNSQQIIQVKGRNIIIPSKAYREYEKSALEFLPELKIDYPVNVECHFYMKTKRKVDLVNLLECVCDVLVCGKTIEDDNCLIVASHDGSRVHYDKDNPRTEIMIRRLP